MRGLVRQGMEDGAFGLSSGLFYVPGTFTPTDEVVELAKVAGQMGGIYISHMRDEAGGVVDSVRETIAIGEQGGLPTQVTHHKVIGKMYWGRSVDTLKLIDEARARGVDATIDQYPYTASSTSIQAALLPAWAQEGGRDGADEAPRRSRHAREDQGGERRASSATSVAAAIRATSSPRAAASTPSLAGKNLAEITAKRGLPVTIENAAETAMWIVMEGGCQGIFHAISEEDLQRILVHPATMIGSDGEIAIFGQDGAASAQLRNVRARARPLRSRAETAVARERRCRRCRRSRRSVSASPIAACSAPGLKADLADLRSGPRRRHRHLREAAQLRRRRQRRSSSTAKIVFEKEAMTPARPGRVLYGPARSYARPVNRNGSSPRMPLTQSAAARGCPAARHPHRRPMDRRNSRHDFAGTGDRVVRAAARGDAGGARRSARRSASIATDRSKGRPSSSGWSKRSSRARTASPCGPRAGCSSPPAAIRRSSTPFSRSPIRATK